MLTTWFERPVWLWWLIPASVAALFLWWWNRRELTRRSSRLGTKLSRRSVLRSVFGIIGSIMLLLAAAGPRWGGAADVATAHTGDVVLLLDVSRSMLTRDAMPDRLQRGQELLSVLVNSLEKRGGWRVGLVVFAGQPVMLCPLTFDLDFVRQRINDVNFADLNETCPPDGVSGTRIGAAILNSLAPGLPGETSATPGKPGANGQLLLVSDGDDPVHDGEWSGGVDAAHQQQVPISVIGVGDPDRASAIPGTEALSKMNEGVLREIASRTNGQFFSAKQLEVDSVVRSLAKLAEETTGMTARSRIPARPTAFLIVGLIALAFAFIPWPGRRAAVGSAVLLVAAAHPTDAWVWRGNQELAAGRPEQALAHYQKAEERTADPGLVAFNEGVALAALHRYRDAELHFRRSLSDAKGDRRKNALYNLGTSLVRRSAGRDRQALQDAITAFEQALALNAENADVKQNLQIAKDLLAQAPADGPSPNEDKNDGKQVAKSADGQAKSKMEKGVGPANKAGKALNKSDSSGGQESDQPPPPGKGNLPVIPDTDVVERITPEDLTVHLDRAAARIAAAQRDQLKSRRPTSKPDYPDW